MYSFAHAFDMEYKDSFSDARGDLIVDDMILLKSLSSNSRSTYIRYVRVTKYVLRHKTLLPLLRDLSVKEATPRPLRVTHVDDATVYRTREEGAMLMIRTTN